MANARLDADSAMNAAALPSRHMTIALAEQLAHRARGKAVSIEQVLERNGLLRHKAGPPQPGQTPDQAPDNLSMQALRLYVPAVLQTALGICLLELRAGVLTIAVGGRVAETEIAKMLAALAQAGHKVTAVEQEPWDKVALARLVRDQAEVATDRLQRLFNNLGRDADNALLVEQAVTDLLAEALQMRCSDIHLTLLDDDARCWIRYRVDGDIIYRHLLPAAVMAPLVTRVKSDAKMDAADRLRPQDGRFSYEWQGRMIDVRVACLPIAPAGQKLTLRLLDRENLRRFDDLFGQTPLVAKRLRRALHGPIKDGGLIVVSGPTGAGKSTTLYGIIQEIDRSNRAVYSVEAPVEYDMPLVDQTSVTDHSANSIAGVIRALMRHDPDVIVVGEIRDSDTVEAALRATESGHLVVTTVHAIDAVHTLDRIEGFLSPAYRTSGLYILGHALIGTLSQRLVKTLCPACHLKRTAMELFGDDEEREALGLVGDEPLAIANPGGCRLCNGSGFLGRTLALEALFPPEDQASRRSMTEMMLTGGISRVSGLAGTIYIPRRDSVRDLVRRGVIDAHMGLMLMTEELSLGRGGDR